MEDALLRAEYDWLRSGRGAAASGQRAFGYLANYAAAAQATFGDEGLRRCVRCAWQTPATPVHEGGPDQMRASFMGVIQQGRDRSIWCEAMRDLARKAPGILRDMRWVLFGEAIAKSWWSVAVAALSELSGEEAAWMERAELAGVHGLDGALFVAPQMQIDAWRAACALGVERGPEHWAEAALGLCARAEGAERESGALGAAKSLWLSAWALPAGAADAPNKLAGHEQTGLLALREALAAGRHGAKDALAWGEAAANRANPKAERAGQARAGESPGAQKRRDPRRV